MNDAALVSSLLISSMDEEMTLKKIAEVAGVSTSTVSRALKGHPRIGAETIQRVREVAVRLGYRNDPSLTELMIRLRRRKKISDRPVVALLIWQHFPPEKNLFERTDTIYGGIWKRAWDCGYQPEVFNLAEFENNGERIAKILWSRGIRGGIFCPVEHPAPLPDISWDKFSIVAVGHSIASHHLHRSCPNHYEGMLDSIEKLQDMGYTRIGAVLSPMVDRRTYGYYHAAYLLSQDISKGVSFSPLLVASEDDEEKFSRWREKWRPEVVICAATIPLVREWLRRQQLNIPVDVGIVDLQIPSGSAATGIWQNAFEVGVAAVDMLTVLLQNNEAGLPAIPRTIYVNGRWVEGDSTKKIPRTL